MKILMSGCEAESAIEWQVSPAGAPEVHFQFDFRPDRNLIVRFALDVPSAARLEARLNDVMAQLREQLAPGDAEEVP